MPRLPVVPWRDVDRALVRLGFAAVRQKGSHVFYRHPDGRTTTVPRHGGRDIAPSLPREILDDIGVTPDEFLTALRSCGNACDRWVFCAPRCQDARYG